MKKGKIINDDSEDEDPEMQEELLQSKPTSSAHKAKPVWSPPEFDPFEDV